MHTDLELVSAIDRKRHCRDQAARPVQRLLLYADELYRVPSFYRQVCIEQGVAYISQNGRDFIVPTGEGIALNGGKEAILVSPLGGKSLVVELCA
jgi:hypothetical protein